MPSKAIGMGVCPRCGKPGTIVIKAGNYVYIKHGNTWHYIGTIDKVNLNKILIKNPESLTLNYVNNKNNNAIKREKIALITLVALSISIMLFAVVFYIIRINNTNSIGYNNYKIINCSHIIFTNYSNSDYIATCNDTVLRYLSNITVINYNDTLNAFDINSLK